MAEEQIYAGKKSNGESLSRIPEMVYGEFIPVRAGLDVPSPIRRGENSAQINLLSLSESRLLNSEPLSNDRALVNGLKEGIYRTPARALAQIFAQPNSSWLPEALPGAEKSSYQLGQTLGSLVPFLALVTTSKGLSNRFLGEELVPSFKRNLTQQSTSGFLLGALLSPTDTNDGNGSSFLRRRLEQGTVLGLTFASMSGGVAALDRFLPEPGSFMSNTLSRKLAIAALSGAAGGVTNAELKSGFSASSAELVNSATGFAAFGLLMEGGSIALSRASLRPNMNPADLNRESGKTTSSEHPEHLGFKPTVPYVTLSAEELPAVRESLLNDMKKLKRESYDGKETNEYRIFMRSEQLTDAQRIRILDVLAHLRDYYAKATKELDLDYFEKRSKVSATERKEDPMSLDTRQLWLALHDGLVSKLKYARNEQYPQLAANLERDIIHSFFDAFEIPRPMFDPLQSNMEVFFKERAEAAQAILPAAGYPKEFVDKMVEALLEPKWTGLPGLMLDTELAERLQLKASTVNEPPAARIEISAADYEVEKGKLDLLVASSFADAKRLERMNKLLLQFEQNGSLRGLSTNEKALFYLHLNRLLSPPNDTLLNAGQRRDLAEQVVNHAAFPTSVDQGCNKTCSVATIENRIYTRTPKEFARMLADIADTGSYITFSGQKIDLANSKSGLTPDAESRAALKMQNDGEGGIHRDGQRDWASQLVELVLAKIKHLYTSEILGPDNCVVPAQQLVFSADGYLRGTISGANLLMPVFDASSRQVYAAEPGVELFGKDIAGNLAKLSDDELVFDRAGNLRGSVYPGKVEELFDEFGNSLKHEKTGPGTHYFDAQGNLRFYESLPGEITYDKLPPAKPESPDVPANGRERMNIRHLGLRSFLKNEMIPISSPLLKHDFHRTIANEVTGSELAPFTIAASTKYAPHFSHIDISTVQELENELIKMQNSRNLPAVLVVHTGKEPWRVNRFDRGGWHAVNLQKYNADSKTVEITNQWGSRFDFTDKGVPLSLLYRSMYSS